MPKLLSLIISVCAAGSLACGVSTTLDAQPGGRGGANSDRGMPPYACASVGEPKLQIGQFEEHFLPLSNGGALAFESLTDGGLSSRLSIALAGTDYSEFEALELTVSSGAEVLATTIVHEGENPICLNDALLWIEVWFDYDFFYSPGDLYEREATVQVSARLGSMELRATSQVVLIWQDS